MLPHYNKVKEKKGDKRKVYHFDVLYEPMSILSNQRHCYIHPKNAATYWEINTQDKSYRRPVCAGCAA
jgi:hypothetical protein